MNSHSVVDEDDGVGLGAAVTSLSSTMHTVSAVGCGAGVVEAMVVIGRRVRNWRKHPIGGSRGRRGTSCSSVACCDRGRPSAASTTEPSTPESFPHMNTRQFQASTIDRRPHHGHVCVVDIFVFFVFLVYPFYRFLVLFFRGKIIVFFQKQTTQNIHDHQVTRCRRAAF